MQLDPQNDNPPEVRINSDGRITNIDYIREYLTEYSSEEHEGIKLKIRWELLRGKRDLIVHLRDFATHDEWVVKKMLENIQSSRILNRECPVAEIWDIKEVVANYKKEVEGILFESDFKRLIIVDLERYIVDLCTLSDELVIEINRHQK